MFYPNGIDKANQLTALEKVTTGKAVTIREGAFNTAPALKTLVISSSVTTIQNNAFYNCKALEEIIFEEGSQLQSVTDSFNSCTSLKSVSLPASIKNLSGNSFRDCTSLETVIFAEGTACKIGSSTFYGCTKLTSVTLVEGITEIGASAFASCTSLESIHIPASITYIGNNCFDSSTKLANVTFTMENAQLTAVGAHGFQKTAIKSIVFPNSLLRIGQSTFSGCSQLVSVNFGANFVDFNANNAGQPPFANGSTLKYVYLPASFDGVRNKIFSWNDNNVNEYNKQYIDLTFFYTGTKEQAQAIIDKAKTGGTDGEVLNTYIATMTLISAQEYASAVANGSLVTGVSGTPARYLVYDYNLCDAFYNGKHTEGVVINSCQFGCGRNCGKAEMLENPQHNLNRTETLENGGYFGNICIDEVCAVCNTVTIDETIAPIFVWKGYSASTFGEGYSVVQGFTVNTSSIEAYKVYAPDFDFGILATVNKEVDEEGNAVGIKPSLDSENVLTGNFVKNKHEYLDIKLTGIPKGQEDTKIVFCVYVTVDGTMYYLDNNTTGESIVGISYNEVLELQKGEVTE